MTDGNYVRQFYMRRVRRLLALDIPWSEEQRGFLRGIANDAPPVMSESKLARLISLEKLNSGSSAV